MRRRNDLIACHAKDLRTMCESEPSLALLSKVVADRGPSIHRSHAANVAPGPAAEIERIRRTVQVRKLGLFDGPEPEKELEEAFGTYGRGERARPRTALCWLPVKRFRREAACA